MSRHVVPMLVLVEVEDAVDYAEATGVATAAARSRLQEYTSAEWHTYNSGDTEKKVVSVLHRVDTDRAWQCYFHLPEEISTALLRGTVTVAPLRLEPDEPKHSWHDCRPRDVLDMD